MKEGPRASQSFRSTSGAGTLRRPFSVTNLVSVTALTGKGCFWNCGFKYCLSFAPSRGMEMQFDLPKPNFHIHRMGTKVLLT